MGKEKELSHDVLAQRANNKLLQKVSKKDSENNYI
jgi:hypothetical protein